MKNKSLLKKIVYSLIIIFVLLLIYFLPFFDLSDKRFFFPIVAILGLLFLILGAVLVFMSRKEKGKLKIALMTTGLSATAPLIFSILHNFFYALAIIFEGLKFLFEALHAISFIIALLIAPLVFIIGAIISLILLKGKVTGKKS